MWLESFAEHLDEACVGQVSEIFDGDAPHKPRGCVAQAWSVAELLRAVTEIEKTDYFDSIDVTFEQAFSLSL
jgi:glycogen debranching enzyme